MPNNAILKISESRASESLEAVVARWLVKFGSVFDKTITPLLKATWYEALQDLDATVVEAACLQVAKTAEFFPSPAAIRKQIDSAKCNAFNLKVEQDWQRFLLWLRRFYHPDLGVHQNAPALAPPVLAAVRAAGGFRFLANCSESELQWAKKRFVNEVVRIHEIGQTQHLLSDAEAKRFVAQLAIGTLENKVPKLAHLEDSTWERGRDEK